MAWATITPSGGSVVDFIDIKGDVQNITDNIELITRPGADGIAARQMGRRGASFNLGGKKDVQTADLDAKRQEILALKGTICTVVRGDSITHANVLIQHVQTQHAPIQSPVGGIEGVDGNYMITAQFQAVDTSAT